MTYPPVIQFETQALEAKAQARLARERRAAGAPKGTTVGRRRFMRRLPLRLLRG
jgi:hypothetical protein